MKILRIKVKPNARERVLQAPVDAEDGAFWLAQLKSPPVDGKANQELVSLVAEYFSCPKSRVSIKHGTTSRIKQVEIDTD